MTTNVLLIAEVGHNFNGNMKLAKLMIEEARACGADIAKFQLYDTDAIKQPWHSRYMELKMSELTEEDAKELKRHCDKVGIEFMASAFDTDRVQWLENMAVRRHKIASRSIYDTDLIRAMEKTGKPIIASLGEWKEKKLPKIKNAEFLFCISEYPARIMADQFPQRFDEYAGFSDHTTDMYWAREAVKRGARIIEKHFTLSHELPGFNQRGSAEVWELKDFVTFCRQHERGISY
jgi:N-acetylneuraminate synthase/N,N'-diacetyllegionaminate synthase